MEDDAGVGDSSVVTELVLRFREMGAETLDKFSSGLTSVHQTATSAANQLEQTARQMSGFGVAMGGAAAASAAFSIHSAIAFDSALQHVRAFALTGADADATVRKWHDEILNMAPALGLSAQNMANGIYDLASAGVQGADAMTALRASSNAAAASHTDLKVVVDALTTAINAYGLRGNQIKTVQDQMTVAVLRGRMEFGEFSAALGQVIPIAAQMHIGMDQLGSMFAVLTNQGNSAAESSVLIRNTLSTLIAPTQTQIRMFKAYHLSLQDLDVAHRGLLPVLRTIADAVGTQGVKSWQEYAHSLGVSEARAKTMAEGAQTSNAVITRMFRGNTEALRAFLALTGSGGAQYDSTLKDMSNATQLAHDAQVEAFKGVQHQMDMARASLEALAIRVGETLLPAVNTLLPPLNTFLGYLTQFAGQHQTTVTASLAIAGAIGAISLAIRGTEFVFTPMLGLYRQYAGTLVGLRARMTETRHATEEMCVAEQACADGGLLNMKTAASQATAEVEGLGTVAQRSSGLIVPLGAATTEAAVGTEAAGAAAEGTTAALGAGGLAGVMPLLLNPVTGIVALGAVAGVIAYEKIPAFHKAVDNLGDALGSKFRGIINYNVDQFTDFATHIDNLAKSIGHLNDVMTQWAENTALGNWAGDLAGKVGHLNDVTTKWFNSLPGNKDVLSDMGHTLDNTAKEHDKHREATERDTTASNTLTHNLHLQGQELAAHTAQVNADAGAHHKHAQAVQVDMAALLRSRIDTGMAMERASAQSMTGMANQAIEQAKRMRAGVVAEARAMQEELAKPKHFDETLLKPTGLLSKPAVEQPGQLGQVSTQQGANLVLQFSPDARSGMATLGTALKAVGPEFRTVGQSWIADYRTQLGAVHRQEIADMNKENVRHAAALTKLNQDEYTALGRVYSQAQQNMRAENSRYVQALQSENTRHSTRLGEILNAFVIDFQMALSGYQQNQAQYRQQEDNARQSHIDRQKTINDEYLQKLHDIHGQNAATQRQHLDEWMSRTDAAENRRYGHDIQTIQDRAKTDQQTFDRNMAVRRGHFNDQVAAEGRTNQQHIAGITNSHQAHIAGIRTTLTQNVKDVQGVYAGKREQEDHSYATHIQGIKDAVNTHVKELNKSLKTLSEPAGLWNKLKSSVDDVATKSMSALSLAIATGKGNIGELSKAAISAAKQQQDLAGANAKAQKIVQDALTKTGKNVTDFGSSLSSVQQAIGTTMNKIETLMLSGQANSLVPRGAGASRQAQIEGAGMPETQAQQQFSILVDLYKKQADMLQIQQQAEYQAAMETGDWTKAIQISSQKISDDFNTAVGRAILDLQQYGYITGDTAAKVQAASDAQAAQDKRQADASELVARDAINSAVKVGDFAGAVEKTKSLLDGEMTRAVNTATYQMMTVGRVSDATASQIQGLAVQQMRLANAEAAAQQVELKAEADAARATGNFALALDRGRQYAQNNFNQAIAGLAERLRLHQQVTQDDITSILRLKAEQDSYAQSEAQAARLIASSSNSLSERIQAASDAAGQSFETFASALAGVGDYANITQQGLDSLRQQAVADALSVIDLKTAQDRATQAINDEIIARHAEYDSTLQAARAKLADAEASWNTAKMNGVTGAALAALHDAAINAAVSLHDLEQIDTDTQNTIKDALASMFPDDSSSNDTVSAQQQIADQMAATRQTDLENYRQQQLQLQQERIDRQNNTSALNSNTSATQSNTSAQAANTAALQQQLAATQAMLDVYKQMVNISSRAGLIRRASVNPRSNALDMASSWASDAHSSVSIPA